MKKYIFKLLVASLFLFFVTPAMAYTIKPGDTPLSVWGKNWSSELAKLGITDPHKLPVGLSVNKAPTQPLKGSAVTSPIAGMTYALAGSGIAAGDSSITLQSLTIPQTGYKLQTSDLSATFYLTLEPGNTKKQEIASCSAVVQNANGTATLTGCSRGLLPFGPYTASTTYAFPHGGGTQAIFSNPPQLYNQFAAINNDETVSGTWKFVNSPQATSSNYVSTNPAEYATVYMLNTATTTGCTNAGVSVKGCVQRATDAMLQSSSSTGSVGAPTFANGGSFAQTSTANKVPVSNGSGVLDPNWINTSTGANYNFGGLITVSGTTTLATTTISTTTITTANIGTGVITTSTITNLNVGTTTISNLVSSNISYVLYQTSTGISLASRTDEVAIIATTTIPGNTLGRSHGVRETLYITGSQGFSCTGSKTATFRFKYGGTALITNTATCAQTDAAEGTIVFLLQEAGLATNSQVGNSLINLQGLGGFPLTVPPNFVYVGTGTSAVDDTVDQSLVTTWQANNNSANDRIEVTAATVEVLK